LTLHTETYPPRLIRDWSSDLNALRRTVDERLAQLVPAEEVPPQKLHRSIRYSLLAPGKRLRPILTLLSARSFGGAESQALDPACAIEMVHAASLIVDDLPCMDNAVERRGSPANHRSFGEDTAMLASLALLNRSFSVLAESKGLSAEVRVQLVEVLSGSLGDCGGAIAGQEEDLEAPDRGLTITSLESMADHKTAALFVASAETGARVAGASLAQLTAAREYARNFGLCFQVLDDLADRPGTAAEGEEDDREKPTFVSVLGAEGAWEAAGKYAIDAITALGRVGLADSPLAELTHRLIATREPKKAVSGL
jgi:geranylgeranyl diphosphate synthase type II